MGKFDGLLLVSDYDDTLFDHINHCLPRRNLEALDYFRAEGGRFTVATGRAHRTFAAQAASLPLDAPVVLSNGCTLYDFQTEEVLFQSFLPGSVREDLGAVCRALPELALEAYHGEDIYTHSPNGYSWAHMEKVGCETEVCTVEEMPLPWTKAIFFGEHQALKQAQAMLLEGHGLEYEAIFSNLHYLEITRKGSTKGALVDLLAGRLGVAPGKIYCVGDNQNDIPMLERSAIPFAPGDCAREVRNWGAKLVCPCAEGVIGDIVALLDKLYSAEERRGVSLE